MDDTPDVLVGIDNPVMLLGDSGDSYIVFGRRSRSGEQATGDLNIAGLRGDQGTRIIGNLTNDRFGTALSPVLAADATGEPGVLVGAPAADPRGRTDAGSAYVIPARTLGPNQEPEATAAASSGDRPAPNSAFKRGFYGGIKKPYPLVFRYDPDYDPNPYNREFDDSFYDLPQTRRTRRNRLQDGKFPTVGEGNGNATRLVKNLTRGTPENPTLHPVMDSYGNAFAYLEQIRRGRFKVYNQNRQLLDETRTDVPSRLGGKRRGQARIELQGRACVAPGVQNAQRLVVVALVSGPATSQTQADPALRANVGKNGNYIGLRGFIDEQAIRDKLEEGSSNAAFINRFRVPCVRPRKKFKPLTAQPEIFGPQGFVRGEDQYVSKAAHYACRDYADTQISNPTARNVRGDPERVDCGQAYATYEAPAGLTPSGQEVALLTRSTTGHTGRGGAVTAIVRLNREWQVIDEVGYQDPNVACSRKRVAKWVFVNANPNGSPIYGWFALRQPLAGDTGYRWNVRLASGSPRTRACAARGVPEPEGGGRGEGPPDTTS